MNKGEKGYLKKVYQDCLELEKECELTEYGKGQLDLCIILLNEDKEAKSKEQRFQELLNYEKIKHLDPKTRKRVIAKMRKDFEFIEKIKEE